MKVITIGRNRDNDIVVAGGEVSRHHCRIVQHDDGRIFVNNFSKNGTFVNGRRVSGEQELKASNEICVGGHVVQWSSRLVIQAEDGKGKTNLVPLFAGIGAAVVLLIVIAAGFFLLKDTTLLERLKGLGGNDGESATVYVTDANGVKQAVRAIPGQVLVLFNEDNTERQNEIVKGCGGVVMRRIENIGYCLVSVKSGREDDFIQNTHSYTEIDAAFPNMVHETMSVPVYVVDNYKTKYEILDRKTHGEVVDKSVEKAYPNCSGCLRPQNVAGDDVLISTDFVYKSLNNIFENHNDKSSPIIINMSFGQYINKGHKVNGVFVPDKDKNGDRINVEWKDSNEDERENWIYRYKEFIEEMSKELVKLEKINPNFIVTKSAGNNGCDSLDYYILESLKNLPRQEAEVLDKHFIFVSAKDRHREGHTDGYSDRGASYNSWNTTVDISALDYPGTSFAAPTMAGYIASMFDKYGYAPEKTYGKSGMTVSEMMNLVRDVTKENYDFKKSTSGLFDISEVDESRVQRIKNKNLDRKIRDYVVRNNRMTFNFGDVCTIEGVLRQGQEDLCETGEPEMFYYVETNPITVYPTSGEDYEFTVNDATRIQIVSDENLSQYLNKKVKVKGELVCHVAGCHIHTDVYMMVESVKLQATSDTQSDKKQSGQQSSNKVHTQSGMGQTYPHASNVIYYNETVELTGKLVEYEYYGTDLVGDPGLVKGFYLEVHPFSVENSPNAENQYLHAQNVSRVYLWGLVLFPSHYVGTQVTVKGVIKPDSKDSQKTNMYITDIHK